MTERAEYNTTFDVSLNVKHQFIHGLVNESFLLTLCKPVCMYLTSEKGYHKQMYVNFIEVLSASYTVKKKKKKTITTVLYHEQMFQ